MAGKFGGGFMRDTIVIRGLEVASKIGVPDQERTEPQKLRVHLMMEVLGFPERDEIEGTVDYKVVADRVVALAGHGERKLIETLAADIADLVLGEFAVLQVRVELEKFILPETDWVGVAIERSSPKRI